MASLPQFIRRPSIHRADPNPDILSVYTDMDAKGEVTKLLCRLSAGDHSAEEALLPRVYIELHRLAAAQLRSERPGHTLQATALVHEAYVRLCESSAVDWQDRVHFFRVAATLMRRILIDYARQRNAIKRGSGKIALPFEEGLLVSDDRLSLVLEIDELLQILSRKAPRLVQIVEMRFFAGLTEAEIASVLKISERTVKRDWLKARAWLHEELSRP